LVDKDGVWYLVAGTERGARTFRVDRVLAASVTDERFERPADFRLSDAWAEVVGTVEARRGATTATVRIVARWVPILRDHFRPHTRRMGRRRRRRRARERSRRARTHRPRTRRAVRGRLNGWRRSTSTPGSTPRWMSGCASASAATRRGTRRPSRGCGWASGSR